MAAARADDTDDGATATQRLCGVVAQLVLLLMLATFIQPRSGVMMMRSRQRYRFLVGLLQMLTWLLAA